jgi:GxxExxY protein
MNEELIAREVVDAAIAVHRTLGPGLLESVYEVVLVDELRSRGLEVQRQVPVSIHYRGRVISDAFRADIIVERKVILELKSVERFTGLHRKQLLTYLRLTGTRLGFLLNFNQALMKNGIARVILNPSRT